MFYPLRCSASERSAKGQSATRSDSQRWRERTRWDGHPAWESTLGPSTALPTGEPANGGVEEKNGGESSDSSRFARGTAVTAKAVRPFLFYAPQSLAPRYTFLRSTCQIPDWLIRAPSEKLAAVRSASAMLAVFALALSA